MAPGGLLLIEAGVAVALLIVLIVRVRLSPFIALTLVSLGLALVVGIPLGGIVKSFEAGVGGALGRPTGARAGRLLRRANPITQ